MKKYIFIFLTICFISSSNLVFSQVDITPRVNGVSLITQNFREELRKNKDSLQICIKSVTMAKFVIDTAGNVAKLTFLEDSDNPPIFRNMLKKILYATNGLWETSKVNGKLVESKVYILPLIYELEAGCYLSLEQQMKNKVKGAKIVKSRGVREGTQAGLIDLLTFEGPSLECIILQQLMFGSVE